VKGHGRYTCPSKELADELGHLQTPKGAIRMRALTAQERALVFSGIDLRYLEAVREMEGGVAYAIPINGTPAVQLQAKLSQAAEHLGLKLAWAKVQRGATEVFCELSE